MCCLTTLVYDFRSAGHEPPAGAAGRLWHEPPAGAAVRLSAKPWRGALLKTGAPGAGCGA